MNMNVEKRRTAKGSQCNTKVGWESNKRQLNEQRGGGRRGRQPAKGGRFGSVILIHEPTPHSSRSRGARAGSMVRNQGPGGGHHPPAALTQHGMNFSPSSQSSTQPHALTTRGNAAQGSQTADRGNRDNSKVRFHTANFMQGCKRERETHTALV